MSATSRSKTAPVECTVAASTPATLSPEVNPSARPAGTELISFAAEFGRLLARRLLADTGPRRGYSLIELMWGATVIAALVLLAARLFGW